MKITPLEIKQKEFANNKTFAKGYDKDDVNVFLDNIAEEWENIIDENKEYKIRVDMLEKEIRKLKEVESSLFRTLKTAEDTSSNIVEQARKNADLKIREAQIKADVILNDARQQAKSIVQKSQNRSRGVIEEMIEEIKKYERDYKDLESYKDNLLYELRGFMNDTLEKVSKFEEKNPTRFFEQKLQQAEEYLEEKNQEIDRQNIENELEEKRTNMEGEAQSLVEADDRDENFFDNMT